MTLVSSTTAIRSLRDGTPLPLLPSVLAHEVYSVLFSIITMLDVAPDLFIQSLIFPDFEALPHVVNQEAFWIAPPFPCSFAELVPQGQRRQRIFLHDLLLGYSL